MYYIEKLDKVVTSAGKYLEDLRVWDYTSGFYESNLDFRVKNTEKQLYVLSLVYVQEYNFLVVGYDQGHIAVYDFEVKDFICTRCIKHDDEEIKQILFDEKDVTIIVFLYSETSQLNKIMKLKLFGGLDTVLTSIYDEKPITYICTYFSIDPNTKEDKKQFVMGLEDGTIAIKQLDNIEDSLQPFNYDNLLYGHENAVTQIIYVDERKSLISCSKDTKIIEWDLENYCLKNILDEGFHEDFILAICYLGNGLIASGGLDRTLIISDIEKGEAKSKHEYHTSSIQNIQKTEKNGKIEVITSSYDTSIRILTFDENFEKRTSMRIINGHINVVKSVQIDYANQKMVTVSTDKTIKFWDFKDMKLLKSIETNKEHFDGFIILNDDYNTLIKHDSSKKIKFYNTLSEENYHVINENTRTKSILNMYDGVSFFVGLDNSEISVYNYFQNDEQVIFKKNKILIHGDVEFSSELTKKVKVSKLAMLDNENKIICSGGSDGSICIFYTKDSKKKYFPSKYNADIVDICAIEVTKKAGIIAYVLQKGNLCIFDFFNDKILNSNLLLNVCSVDRINSDLLVISYNNINKVSLYQVRSQQIIYKINFCYKSFCSICSLLT